MDTKRYILAIGLSMIVLIVYMRFFGPQPVPVESRPAAEQAGAEQQPAASRPAETAAAKPAPPSAGRSIVAATQGKEIIIETDLVKAAVNTAGGVITRWELKHFREADKSEVGVGPFFRRLFGGHVQEAAPAHELGNVQLFTRYAGVSRDEVIAPLTLVPTEKSLEKLSSVEYRSNQDSIRLDRTSASKTLILTYRGPGGLSVEKRLTFHNDSYRMDVEILTTGLDGYHLSLGTDFGMSDKVSSNASGRVGVAAIVDNKLATEKFESIKGELQQSGAIEWFGQHDKYFAATLLSGAPGIVTTKRTPAPKEIGDLVTSSLLVKDKPGDRTFTLYAGPMSFNDLQAYGKGLEQLVDYGWFGILARPMFWLMNQFYAITRNYGIAIILLTIVVRALLFYPSLKSATAMEEMKALQPEMNALREKYKKDPQKMNQEIMRLYKEHKVNPLGGCLPMLLQLPFFVALYNVLSVSIELRQSPFISFWIKDLSVHDPFYILPVLMGVSMVATMQMTSTSVDPQQKKMMMFMNIAFIFLFAWLPAGLLLYITLSNVLSIVQQLYVRRLIATGK